MVLSDKSRSYFKILRKLLESRFNFNLYDKADDCYDFLRNCGRATIFLCFKCVFDKKKHTCLNNELLHLSVWGKENVIKFFS